jgi:GNAT superfamily N-acetyltransferase
MTVRDAAIGDVTAIQDLSRAVGQSGVETGADPSYVALLLATATVKVAADGEGGQLTGWGAVRPTPLGSLLCDLFVDPGHHGRGVGRSILESLWSDHTAPKRLTFSSQHANALPLYARAGLYPTWPLLYLTGPRSRLPASSLRACPVDVDVACAADADLAGGNRAADYEFWTGPAGRGGITVLAGEAVVAAGVLRDGELVHLTCPDPAAAQPALLAALHTADHDFVSACVPGQHPSLGTLLRAGFRVTDHDLAMTTPDVTLPASWVYSPGLA